MKNLSPNTVSNAPLRSLQDELDRITQNTRALVQPERLAISEQASAELFATGIEDRILQPGAQAPDFTLPDALTGKPVHSADLLAMGPLVIKFFRGRWCPYCVTELEVWRDLHTQLRDLGAFSHADDDSSRLSEPYSENTRSDFPRKPLAMAA